MPKYRLKDSLELVPETLVKRARKMLTFRGHAAATCKILLALLIVLPICPVLVILEVLSLFKDYYMEPYLHRFVDKHLPNDSMYFFRHPIKYRRHVKEFLNIIEEVKEVGSDENNNL